MTLQGSWSEFEIDICRRIFHATWQSGRLVRLPANTLRECGHPGTAG
jgi:hypothetical protein